MIDAKLGRKARVGALISACFLAGSIGCCSGMVLQFMQPFWPATEVTHSACPLPHHVAKYPGNLTLRFAMVHDVIHERFPQHGTEYYRARNREVEMLVANRRPMAKTKDADEYFRLIDDWAVGLAFVGEYSRAVDMMRDKLKHQEALLYGDEQLYSSYANLGTFLILWQLREGVKDVAQAKQRIGESVSWIRRAIAAYPQSHFGRERWQLELEKFLLAVLDNPELLLRFDMVGNRLDRPVDLAKAVCFDQAKWLDSAGTRSRSRGNIGEKAESLADQAMSFLRNDAVLQNDAMPFRACIQRVGAEEGWKLVAKSLDPEPSPFDEPTLGIVGMWRMGAGANPYFALALGEIMLRVGQGYIAWTAYERAFRMKEHFWSDSALQERFAEHCSVRQRLIEQNHPNENWAAVRLQFESELVLGERYQRDYRNYEAARIANGASVYNPHFHDEFELGREPIASLVGDEDRTFGRRSVTYDSTRGMGDMLPGCLLLAGAAAFVVALIWTFSRKLAALGR